MKEELKLKSIEDWEAFKKSKPETNLVCIFKFSPICGVSFSREKILSNWYKNLPKNSNLSLVTINVISAKVVSSFIAREFSIRHESPQLIFLGGDFHLLDHSSHYEIDEEFLNTQIKKIKPKI